jgi:RNA polymerase sigma factor (sigma-70 family)
MLNFSDEELLHKIAQGGTVANLAWGHFYDRYALRIKKWLIQKSRNITRQDAEDLFQEVCCKIDDNAHKFNGESAAAWVYKIAQNTLLDKLKKTSSKLDQESISIDDDPSPIDVLSSPDDSSSSYLNDCVDALLDKFSLTYPERYEAIDLQADGLPIKEISTLIGRSLTATKEFLSQSKNKLKEFISPCFS